MSHGWRSRNVLAAVGTALLILAGGAPGILGRDWPQLRGMNRDGTSTETGLLRQWPETGPAEVWRRPIGEGYSAVTVVGDRLYTMYAGEHEGTMSELAAAFDAASGEELWRTPVGRKFDTEFGNGPRSTPTVDGDAVFVLGSEGDFAALSAEDGTVRWKLSLTETFGSKVPQWGFATSALVDGDQVVIEAGGADGKSYVALDRKTGEVRWTHGSSPPGYNSSLPVELAGRKHYVHVAQGSLVGVDVDGNEVWSAPWPRGETHAMPVFVPPDRIFASGAEGVGARLMRVAAAGEQATVEELWQTRFMRNHFSSSVVDGDHIYGFDNATLKAISIETGEMAWGKRGLGKGSLILVDGHLLVLSDRGKLLLLEATPEGYVEKGSVQALEGKCWTAPTFANGRLYLRNHEEMVVYDIAG